MSDSANSYAFFFLRKPLPRPPQRQAAPFHTEFPAFGVPSSAFALALPLVSLSLSLLSSPGTSRRQFRRVSPVSTSSPSSPAVKSPRRRSLTFAGDHDTDDASKADDVTSSPSAKKISAIKANRKGGRGSNKSGERNSDRELSSGSLPVIEHVKLDGDRKVIKAASIAQLVEQYSENSADAESLQHLAVAHAHFISSTDLLVAIIKQYKSMSENSNFQKQYRIINILKTWLAMDKTVASQSDEFSAVLQDFVKYLNDVSPSIGSYLSSTMELRNSNSGSLVAVDSIQLGSAALSSKFSSQLPRLSDFAEADIAKQLCLIDQAFIKKIPLSEFHKARWTRNEAPKIEAAGSFANKLAYWLALQILTESKVKDQLKLWTHVIMIGKNLLQLQNFNSLLAVYLSLQNTRIKQLQLEWGSKAKKAVQTLKQFESVMSPLNNFAAYRAHIKELHYPLIPCIEIFLKDLLYQAEGSPDCIEDQRVLNVLKLDSMGRLIMQVVNSQNTPYEFEHNEALGALFASFFNRPATELNEELESIIDNADWNAYLSMSKKDIESLVVAENEDSDTEKEKKQREKKAVSSRKEAQMKEQLAAKDSEILVLKARVAELETEVRRLRKGKD